MDIVSKLKIRGMKKKIRTNPFIGIRDIGNTFKYKEGGITIRYAMTVSKTPAEKRIPYWISVRIKTPSRENILKKMSDGFMDFWRYQKWIIFFHPSTLIVLTLAGLIIYVGAVELQPGNGYVIRWLISRATGVSSNEIQYEGKGWIRIYGVRTTTADREREPFSYDVNVFRWLVFNDAGSVTRGGNARRGPISHKLGYDESGQVYIKKEGAWQKGEIGNGVKWDRPQGTGIREEKVKGETIGTTQGKLEVHDK